MFGIQRNDVTFREEVIVFFVFWTEGFCLGTCLVVLVSVLWSHFVRINVVDTTGEDRALIFKIAGFI